MEPFTIDVSASALDDLRARLRNARFTTASAPGTWVAGTDPDYLRELVHYWAEEFDWHGAQTRLNAYPQFLAEGVHFVHTTSGTDRLPLLLTHGWPSGFTELLPLVDLLRDDFNIVVPSLPGFLYSGLPDEPLTRLAMANAFHRLMTETLGYSRYVAFGGDIGGVVSSWLAAIYPDEVAGLHMIHGPFPASFDSHPLTPAEQAFFAMEAAFDTEDEGYSSIMGTRPDTLAAALIDSPVGLAAWIIDKYRAWSDSNGNLERHFDRDYLCTILTLYWATGSIGTSFRQYYDYRHNSGRPDITVPVGVTLAHEPGMTGFPRSIAERAAIDIRHYSEPQRGGHFLALEEPALVAAELRAFIAKLD